MAKLKVTAIGNSSGVILPNDLLAKLRVNRGDHLYLIETPSGFELSPYDPDFEEQMEAAEKIMRRDRTVLKKLSE
ncbi:MAG: AbrB/MazE/SpoVT family DNA-binding domain-containing protein [Myxococcales bacterium]|nr:MAG: AbrB/MazE/SpoVT family DNA-binding domain-containing protein [Myxococcales bacterium]